MASTPEPTAVEIPVHLALDTFRRVEEPARRAGGRASSGSIGDAASCWQRRARYLCTLWSLFFILTLGCGASAEGLADETNTTPPLQAALPAAMTAVFPAGAPADITLSGITDLIGVLIWPVVVGGALWLFRIQIGELVGSLGGRIKSISAFGWALELTELHPVQVASFEEINALIPTPVGEVGDIAQIATTDADYAVIDLREGREWQTRYLYISAMLLERTTARMQYFVFVSGIGHDRYRFEGVAELSRVCWMLAQQYPWLEQAFAQAYRAVLVPPSYGYRNSPPDSVMIDGRRGALAPGDTKDLREHFLQFTRQDLLYLPEDVLDPQGLAASLNDGSIKLSAHIMKRLKPEARQRIAEGAVLVKPPDDFSGTYTKHWEHMGRVEKLRNELVAALNAAIEGGQLYDKRFDAEFRGFPQVTRDRMIPANPEGRGLCWLNRLLLDDAYGRDLAGTSMRPTDSESGELPFLGDEWTKVSESDSIWRHARWVDATLIERVMGPDLRRAHLREADLVGKTRQDQARLVLTQTGSVVPIAEDGGRFSRLLDRRALVDAVAREASS